MSVGPASLSCGWKKAEANLGQENGTEQKDNARERRQHGMLVSQTLSSVGMVCMAHPVRMLT